MKKLKYLIIILQIFTMISLFWFGFSLPCNSDYNVYGIFNFFNRINDILNIVVALNKTNGTLWILFNNFIINAIQSIASAFTLGIFGILSLAKDFLIYGYTFKYNNGIFIYLELLTTAISIILSTNISFQMYTKKKNILDSLSMLSYVIILSFIPLIIAAIIEGNIVYQI